MFHHFTDFPTRVRTVPKNVRYFLITVVCYGIAVEGIGMVLLNLYLLRLGYGTEFIGTLNSVGLLAFAIVSLPIGAVRRLSSREMMLTGQILSLIGLIGLPLAPFAPFGQAFLLVAFRIFVMLGLSCHFVHQIPFALEITRPAWHNRIMSWTMAAFSLAAFLGSWIGGLLPEWASWLTGLPTTDPWTFQLPMLATIIVMIPAIWAIFMVTENRRPAANQPDVETAASSPGIEFGSISAWKGVAGLLVLIIVVRSLQTSGVGVMVTFSNVYFDDALGISTGRIGLISGLGRLLGVPLSLTIPWLMGRFGNFRLVLLSLGAIAALMIPIAFIPSWPVAAVALIAINSMGSLRYLSFISYTMSLVREEQRSLVSGAGEMAIGLGFSISSLIGGYLIAWSGYRDLFLFGALVTTIGAGVFWLLFRRQVIASRSVTASV